MAESNTSQQQSGSPQAVGSSKSEFPCPDCGEMVRDGVVRCWNCGGFLRPDLEKKFKKILSRPQQIIYSPPVSDEDTPDLDAMMAGPSAASTDQSDDEEGGFQLTGGGTSAPAAPTEAASSATTSEDEPTEKKPAAPDEDALPHSQATAGDVLMQLAAQEEMERLKRRVERGSVIDGVKQIRDGFLIDAPKGCRIQVRDERTGELRRLTFGSSSRVRVSLLDKLEAIHKAEAEKEAEAAAGPQHLSAGKYERWMSDCHLHTLNPEKLKLKADSMAKEFVPVEVGFAADSMLVASLASSKKSGLFGSGGKSDKSDADPRTALLEHFRAGKALADAPAGTKKSYSADQVAELRIVQPTASLTESLFAGIPVFGTGRIAVQLPHTEKAEQPQFLSFTLTQFREFVEIIGSLYSMAEFGRNMGIPLADAFTEHKCHFSDVKIRALEYLTYYQNDPEIDLVLAGWLCSACGIVVSEDARQKEKLGGKGGKGIAKVKCPKCDQKFGSNPLYTLASVAQSPSMSGDQPEDEPEAADSVEASEGV